VRVAADILIRETFAAAFFGSSVQLRERLIVASVRVHRTNVDNASLCIRRNYHTSGAALSQDHVSQLIERCRR